MPRVRHDTAGTSPYRDGSGRALTDYPRPSVAVDTALLTVAPGSGSIPAQLAVLLVRSPAASASRRGWALPGTFLHPGETLADAVRRSLATKAGVTGRTPAQLHVLDDPCRDDRGWVLSVAHLDVAGFPDLDAMRHPQDTRIATVNALPRLPYDHKAIVGLAVERLRAEYAARPDPRGLCGPAFAIADLRALHEAVLARPLQKDTFRRAVLPRLRELPSSTSGRVGRPARLYARRA